MYTNFSNRLEQVIAHYDLNRGVFADKIGVPRSSISHILSGRNKPSLDFVMKTITTFPEVNLYWLLNGKGSFPQSSKKSGSSPTLLSSVAELPSLATHAKFESYTKPDSKEVSKVVLFYTDGTFEEFITKK